jgi:hypothetical protein
MEADWEIETGPQAPIIEALWEGFIDLRQAPHRIHELEEARRFAPLAQALLQLNSPAPHGAPVSDSAPGVWTAKCDLWPLEASALSDPYELNATAEECAAGLACYLDLLPRAGLAWSELSEAESWAHQIVAQLQATQIRSMELRCCRADLVIRAALAGAAEGFGVTAYLSACGKDADSAAQALGAALVAFTHAVSP